MNRQPLLFWNQLAQDLRHAFRILAREPIFSLVAIVIMALGIGATTAVFSIFDGVLLRPLPFRDSDRLVRIANTGSGLSGVTSRASNLRDWKSLSESFEDMGGYFAFFDYSSYNMTGKGQPERLVGVGVTEGFLDLLGVEMRMGRNFVEEECVWNGRPAAILTYAFWMRRFGGDLEIVGQSVTLNDRPTEVVGVLPASFDFASVFSPASQIDLLVPFPVADETDRWGNTLAVIGRLKPAATVEAAQAELDSINRRLKEAQPDRWGLEASLTPLQEHVAGGFRRALLVLMAAVGLVLLITCINLSNLLLARGEGRRAELTIRSALGAGRGRLIRQMLTESLVLSSLGAILGTAVAFLLTRGVAASSSISIPLLSGVQIDGTALLFTVAAAAVTGVLFGIVPALHLTPSGRYDSLRDSGRGSTQGRQRAWIREGLIISEVALACVLLVGAGLLLRSFVELLNVDLGFRPSQAAAWRVDFSAPHPERVLFYQALKENLEGLPGVEMAGLTDTLPLGRNRSWGLAAKGISYEDGEYPVGLPRMIDRGYLKAMGIPLLEGRDFNESDSSESERVMILNETAAKALWPGESAVGRVATTGGREFRVVGVAADVRHSSLEEEADNEMYMNVRQESDWGAVDIVLRSRLPAESLAGPVGRVIAQADPDLPRSDYRTLGQIVDQAVSPRRFVLYLIGGFAAAALILATLGIYGVVSYSVSQRTNEIGIRMALGASAWNVRRKVIARTMAMTGSGILAGLVVSWALSRSIASLLYGVSPFDGATLLASVTVLVATALAAGYFPASRASRIDPIHALKAE